MHDESITPRKGNQALIEKIEAKGKGASRMANQKVILTESRFTIYSCYKEIFTHISLRRLLLIYNTLKKSYILKTNHGFILFTVDFRSLRILLIYQIPI